MFFFIVKHLTYSVVEFVECVEWFFTPQKSTVEGLPGTKKNESRHPHGPRLSTDIYDRH